MIPPIFPYGAAAHSLKKSRERREKLNQEIPTSYSGNNLIKEGQEKESQENRDMIISFLIACIIVGGAYAWLLCA